ncbi:armadillo-type protein [Chytriomyces sp. MP71]|nr:armadillo-type protein [Chytriomyces sp. MP71]
MAGNSDFQGQYGSLREQARSHESGGRYDLAVSDLRRALSLVPTDDVALRTTTSAELTRVLMRMSSAKEREASIDNLLETALGTSEGAGMEEADSLRHRIASSERAAVLVRDEGVGARVATSQVTLNGLVAEAALCAEHAQNLNGTIQQLNSDLGLALVSVLANIAKTPPGARAVATALSNTDSALPILVPLSQRSLLLATRSLDLLQAIALSLGAEYISLPIASEAIDLLSDCLKEGCPDTLRLTALNTLIKISASVDLSLTILRHPIALPQILCMSAYGAAAAGAREEASSTAALRNVVPVAMARFLDPILNEPGRPHEKEAKALFGKLILDLMDSERTEQRTQGLLSLTHLFTVNPSHGSALLLASESRIPDILDLLSLETPRVQRAALAMLSAACGDAACRRILATPPCRDVLLRLWRSGSTVAAGVLVKCMAVDREMEASVLAERGMVSGFLEIVKRGSRVGGDQEEGEGQEGVEGAVEALAYLSVKGFVKEMVAGDVAVVKGLLGALKRDDKAVQYGVVTIFNNLTGVRRRLTEEEEQLMKLKEVSGESVAKLDILDDDKKVEERCAKLMASDVNGPLAGVATSSTMSLASVVAQLYLNLCNDKRNRGKIVQGGGVKALTSLINKLVSPTDSPAYLIAAQALAKIAITTDPHLAFTPVSRALDLVRPLVYLLNAESTLQQFEGLMALTNLASYDDSVRTRIVSAQGVRAMEYLQFSDNTLVRRAATESLCNMMLEPSVFAAYAGAKAGSQLKMLVALCDAEDYETRRAAGGALAILSASPDACRLLLGDPRGVDIVLGLLFHEEEHANPELLLRGVEICKNVAAVGGTLAQRLASVGIVKVLRGVALHPDKQVAMGAIEALQNLQKAGVQVLSKQPPVSAPKGPKIEEID